MKATTTSQPDEQEFSEARSWVWTAKDGTKTQLGDMPDSYLENLSSFAQRNLDRHKKAHEEFFLWMIDDKNRSSFSGHEQAIEAWEIAVKMTSTEILRRGAVETKTPA